MAAEGKNAMCFITGEVIHQTDSVKKKMLCRVLVIFCHPPGVALLVTAGVSGPAAL